MVVLAILAGTRGQRKSAAQPDPALGGAWSAYEALTDLAGQFRLAGLEVADLLVGVVPG
jgi:hypothetical protein